MTTEDKKVIITINEVDYTEDQLTNEHKAILSHINSLQQKISSAKFNLDQLEVGKDAFLNLLDVAMKERPSEEDK